MNIALLSGFLKITPGQVKKKIIQLCNNQKNYSDRILMIGNKFSGHLFDELNIDPKEVQTGFGKKDKANKFCTSKYTLFTFLPLNLCEQFRRLANIYFLLSLLFAFIFPGTSPVSPNSLALPLFFVVAVTMLKQGYEDFLRHKSDK